MNSNPRRFKSKCFLIKLGGSLLDDDVLIGAVCEDIKRLQEAGIRLILVHGGGKSINRQLHKLGIESSFIEGLRVTSREAMDVIEASLCGSVNSALVRKLNQIGVKAVGLSGCDNKLLQCSAINEELGFVGKIDGVNKDFLSQFVSPSNSIDALPVIAPVGMDELGRAFNINADVAACAIAKAMNVDKLIYLTDTPGILSKQGTLYSVLTAIELQQLIDDETIQGGMLIKARAILSALSQLHHVHVLSGVASHALIEEIFTPQGVGTLCKQSMNQQEEEVA